jgi:hypothetical protein
MSILKKDGNLKLLSTAAGLVASCCLAVSLQASEVVTCESPDGKFALRHRYAEQQPYAGDTAIIEVATDKTVQPLDFNWEIGELKLLWSRDSQRVSYFADNTRSTENVRCSTRVFFRNGWAFHEIKLPELPSPQLPSKAATESDKKTNRRVEPIDWLKLGSWFWKPKYKMTRGAERLPRSQLASIKKMRRRFATSNSRRCRLSIIFCSSRRICSKDRHQFGYGMRKPAAIFIFARPRRAKRISMKKTAI